MNKSNTRHLRWLIPLIIYYVIMAITLRTYWTYSYSRAVEAKENEIAFDVEMSLDNIDFSVENAMSRITQLGESLSLYTHTDNKNQITLLLKNMVEETELSNSFVCDLDGVGYDMDGRDIRVGEESYFGAVTAEYSRGGVGMILPDGQADMDSEILIVNGITYSNKEKGPVAKGSSSISPSM